MRKQMLAPAALVAALAGSSVAAQNQTGINLKLPQPGFRGQPVTQIAPGHNMRGPATGTVIVDRQPWRFQPGVGFVPLNTGGGFQRRDQFQWNGSGMGAHGGNQLAPMAAGGFANGGFAPAAANTPTGASQVNPVTAAGVPSVTAGGINTPTGASQINPVTAQGTANAGFVNGTPNGFNTFNDGAFFGNGFVPVYGGPYWGGAVALTPQPMLSGAVPTPVTVPRSPVLGINVPVQPLVGRPWNARNTRFVGIRDPQDRMVQARRTGQPIVDVPAGGPEEDRNDVTTRVAGSREETRMEETTMGEIRSAPADPEQLRMAQRVENIMENRPLREGQVTAIGASGVVVRYDLNGQMKTERFSVDQAFFFDESGRLATISSAPGSVSVGDRVMIPTEGSRPRQAVAGSREIIRETVIRERRPAASRTTIRSRVAGSRQSTRSRRLAK
jgi:hypothetical protein